MAQLVFANNATSTIAGAITNTSTSVSLQTGEGALFPSPTGGDYFIGSFVDAATGLLTEIVKCTARSGDVLTIVRAQESTSALPWNPGDFFSNLWTAGQAAEMLQQGQVPGSITYYGTDTGSANAIVATMAPALSALATGDLLEITVLHANTSSTVTLNASTVGAHNVYRADGSALAIGDIQASPYVGLFSWNGNTNQFLLLNPATYIANPAGQIIAFAGSSTPPGFLPCDGSAVSRTVFLALFNNVGTLWGVGDGSTTFNVPNLVGRVLAGVDPSGTNLTGFATVGTTGGAQAVVLTTPEIPSHTHAVTDPGHVHAAVSGSFIQSTGSGVNANLSGASFSSSADTASAVTGVTNQNTGGGGSHPNVQPTAAVNYFIKY